MRFDPNDLPKRLLVLAIAFIEAVFFVALSSTERETQFLGAGCAIGLLLGVVIIGAAQS